MMENLFLKNVPWVESPFFYSELKRRKLSDEVSRMATEYHEQGYVIIENVLSADECDEIIKQIKPLFPPEVIEGPRSRYRCTDAWKESPGVRKLAINDKVMGLIQTLYGREPIPFQTLNFLQGSQQATHADTIHFHSYPEKFMCGAWAALEDVHSENGPLHYYPGSHKLPLYDIYDLGLSVNQPDYKKYEEFISSLMAELKLERKELHVKKGSVLIWSANLFHGGSAIKKENSTRFSQVTHFYFDGCFYYSPIFSNLATGELFLNDFKDKLNIKTLKPIQHSYNGNKLIATPLTGGRFHVQIENEAPSLKHKVGTRLPWLKKAWHGVKPIFALASK